MATELSITTTPIPGVLLLTTPLHRDNRGWFKEAWQRDKMVALGLPDFSPVQHNISFNDLAGTTRGVHAEPWDKLVAVASGRVFGAWIDLREGDSFGTVFTTELDPGRAMYVPRGVGNALQTLEPRTTYSYLVNDHWREGVGYCFLNLADESIAIDWPIPLTQAILSDKDRDHPRLAEISPIRSRQTLILGSNGQLGQALVDQMSDAVAWGVHEFDMTDPTAWEKVDWREFDCVINAAGYTDVDAAETPQGRRAAWNANVHAVVHLARSAIAHNLTVVHVSSDYVFDGEQESHPVDELFSPLGVYGQTKAAADAVIMTLPKHYIVRTSWLIGNGPNFVRTMQLAAESGVNPGVVNDQIGRLTYVSDLACGIADLLTAKLPYGTYNITSAEGPQSWFQIAQEVFADAGHDPERVRPISTSDYISQHAGAKLIAPRPRHSTLE